MADATDPNIPQVLAALEVFSGKPDRASLEKANTWLQTFQHSPESWSTCNILLLSNNVPDAARQFAAQSFRAKVTHDLHQLDATQRAGLRDTLLSALQRYAAGPRPILIQVCLALSGLALQMKDWENAAMDVVNALGSNPATVPALLQFLTVLPEEVSSNTRIPMSSEDFRYQEARLLTSNAPEVLRLLTLYTQATGVTPALQTQIFKCLRSWVAVGELTPGMVAETPLLQSAFDALAFDELFDAGVDVICGLIHETQEVYENMAVIQVVVPLIISHRPMLSSAIAADDSDKVRGYARIVTEAGETYRLLLLQHVDTFFPIVEAIGECAAYHDLDVVPITFHFWYRLAQSIGKKPDVPQVFLDTYRSLMGIMIKHLHFSANPETMTPQERDEFRNFRHIMGDTLKDCCYVLGTDGCLLTTYEMITEALARGTSGQAAVSWQEIEAPLFSMRSMGAEVNPDDDEIMPKIMDLIPQLPSHPRVRYAAIMVISRYTEWTDKHPSYIPFQLTYVSTGFEDPDPEVAAASGQAMKYLCKDCRQHLVPYLAQLHQFVQTMGSKLIQDDRIQVYEAIAYVITSMPMNEAGESLKLLSLDLIKQIHDNASKPGASKEQLTVVADALELLEAMLIVVGSFGEELPLTCQSVAADVYAVLDTLIVHYGQIYFVSERVCRVLRQGMVFFGLSAASLIPGVLRRISTAFQTTGFSSYLWLQGKVVGFFGTTPDPAIQRAIGEAFELSSSQVFAMMKIQAPADMPDVIEDYVHLAIQTLDFAPDHILLSPSFDGAVKAVLTCLTLVVPDAIFPALDLIRSLVGHDSLDPASTQPSPSAAVFAPAIRKVISDNGFQMTGLILSGMVTHFPEDAIHLIISIVRMVAAVWPTELAAWLPPVVEQLPTTAIPRDAKTAFLTSALNALSAGSVDNVKEAVLNLHRTSRKTRERTRDLRGP